MTIIIVTGHNKPFESNICAVTTADTGSSGRAQRLSLQGRVTHKTCLWIRKPITSPDKGWWGPRARELSSEQRKSENEYDQDPLLEPLPVVLHLQAPRQPGLRRSGCLLGEHCRFGKTVDSQPHVLFAEPTRAFLLASRCPNLWPTQPGVTTVRCQPWGEHPRVRSREWSLAKGSACVFINLKSKNTSFSYTCQWCPSCIIIITCYLS